MELKELTEADANLLITSRATNFVDLIDLPDDERKTKGNYGAYE